MNIDPASTPPPVRGGTVLFDLVRPGLFRRDAENVGAWSAMRYDGDDAPARFAGLDEAIAAAREATTPDTSSTAVVQAGAGYELFTMVQFYGPGPGGPFEVSFRLPQLQERDRFERVHPALQAIVAHDAIVQRDRIDGVDASGATEPTAEAAEPAPVAAAGDEPR